MTNKIQFIASSADVYNAEKPPVPAKTLIPNWFKEIPPERDLDGTFTLRHSSTVKKCTPFMDALTTGYMVTVPQDIAIKIIDGKQYAYWGVDRYDMYTPTQIDPIFSADVAHRYEGLPTPNGCSSFVWRMTTYPQIKTPIGYSILVTHPFNRYDLPFLALSGVIDSDKMCGQLSVNVYLKEGFEGILEKGTPVAQIFPFKREDWEHEVLEPMKKSELSIQRFNLYSKLSRSYHNQFWSKKKYE
jgi:hypothetical protein